MKRLSYLLETTCLFFAIAISSCDKNTNQSIPEPPVLNISPSPAPISVPSGAKFYSNVSYDNYPETVFDIFVPASGHPTGLLIKIHGGGFRGGDKSDNYSNKGVNNEISTYLLDTIAVANLNYRLLQPTNENEGVLKPLNDCKRALQFIRYYCQFFNIDKSKVVLQGGSAGAGTSLWIGLNNDMANSNATDPIERESTKVKGIVANTTQSTYDVLSWPTAVYSVYPALTLDSMITILSPELLMGFYGISDTSQLFSPAITAYRAKVDMLAMMSADDPEIYVATDSFDNVFPNSIGLLEHHPLQSKAVMDRAIQAGIPVKAYIPKLGIDNTNGESAQNFVRRKLKN
ncbi:MAG: alpha/beta hydrolase [Bacteroidetes bacterium]|nr:alpha/beta hydrolase [Bacteroidota bacterium]MBS1756365.1 alpha/beta hydrolase [Bacteroidota bacterium]